MSNLLLEIKCDIHVCAIIIGISIFYQIIHFSHHRIQKQNKKHLLIMVDSQNKIIAALISTE